MKITEIDAAAGRTFNHPHEDYSNLRPSITLRAVLTEGDDPVACAKTLQQTAEQLVEDQKIGMLKALDEAHEMGEARSRMIGLARQLKAAQEEMDTIRQQWPQASQIALPGTEAGA
jgi:hypothetical protein